MKLIWITGRSGAGKTTLGEHFKTRKDCIHYDADQFAKGNDAVIDSGKTIEKHHYEKRSSVFALTENKNDDVMLIQMNDKQKRSQDRFIRLDLKLKKMSMEGIIII